MPHLEVPRRPCPQILHLASQLQALALGPAAIHFRLFVEAAASMATVHQAAVLLVLLSEHMTQLDHPSKAQLHLRDWFCFTPAPSQMLRTT